MPLCQIIFITRKVNQEFSVSVSESTMLLMVWRPLYNMSPAIGITPVSTGVAIAVAAAPAAAAAVAPAARPANFNPLLCPPSVEAKVTNQ